MLAGHALNLMVAIGLGWLWMVADGFGCAVGDPPYEKGCADVDFGAIWLKASIVVLLTIYAFWSLARLSVTLLRRVRN